MSYESVYRAHSTAVYSLAVQVCGASMAHDVTQDVFLRRWRRPESFDPTRGTLRTYLLVTVRHTAVDHLRLHDTDWLRKQYALAGSTSIAAQLGCSSSAVRKALAQLGIERRPSGVRPPSAINPEIVRLHAEGWSLRGIARELGIGTGRVKRALSR